LSAAPPTLAPPTAATLAPDAAPPDDTDAVPSPAVAAAHCGVEEAGAGFGTTAGVDADTAKPAMEPTKAAAAATESGWTSASLAMKPKKTEAKTAPKNAPMDLRQHARWR
jgi:hypothetical protein